MKKIKQRSRKIRKMSTLEVIIRSLIVTILLPFAAIFCLGTLIISNIFELIMYQINKVSEDINELGGINESNSE